MSTNAKSPPKLVIFDWEGTLGLCGGELIPGVKQTLECLTAHKIDLAIATSMSTARLKELVAEHQLADFFVYLQTSEMGFPKPDPQMLIEILESTEHSAANTIMIGDCTYDLIMAEQAQIAPFGVLTGGDNQERLLAAANNVIILESVSELPVFFSLEQECH